MSMARLAVLAAAATAAVAQNTCVFDTGYGTTFELLDMSGGQGYRIRDGRNNSAATGYVFDYYVSFCGDLAALPDASCAPAADGSIGPAYQVGYNPANPSVKTCARLAYTAANATYTAWARDTHLQTVAKGFSLGYSAGDMCNGPSGPVQRNVSIDFICTDTNGFNPTYDIVEEVQTCDYRIQIRSKAGCPTQCPLGGPARRLCSNNGICDYDQSGGYSKCFCNQGYSGKDCTTPGDAGLPPPKSWAGAVAGYFFLGLFLGVVAAYGYFVVRAKMAGDDIVSSLKEGLRFGVGAPGGVGAAASGAYVAAPASAATPSFVGAAESSAGYVAPEVPVPTGDGPLLA